MQSAFGCFNGKRGGNPSGGGGGGLEAGGCRKLVVYSGAVPLLVPGVARPVRHEWAEATP